MAPRIYMQYVPYTGIVASPNPKLLAQIIRAIIWSRMNGKHDKFAA